MKEIINDSEKAVSSMNDERTKSFDKLIFIYLILSITLPALLSIPHDILDMYYWKEIALFTCVSMLLILLVIRWVKYRVLPVDWKTHLPIAVLLLILFLSSFFSDYRRDVLLGSSMFREGVLALVSYYIIFVAFKYYVSTSERIKKAYSWIFFSGIILYAYAWFQTLTHSLFDTVFTGGTFGHRNYMASYYTLLLVPVMALFFYTKDRKEKIIYYALSCAFFSTIIIVHTRSAWVGNTIGLALFAVLAWKKITWKKAVVLFASFILIVFAVNSFYDGLLTARFNNMVEDAKLLTDTSKPKTDKEMAQVGNYRYPIWILTLRTAPEYIWLGAGPDMLENVFPQGEFRKLTGMDDRVGNAHNEYLNMLINTGIFSLLAYLALAAIIIWKFIKTYKLIGMNSDISPLAIGAFCGWIAYLIQAFFNNSVVPTSPTLWAIMGMLSTFPYIFKDSDVEKACGKM